MSANNLNIDLGDLVKKFTPLNKRRYLGWRIIYIITVGAILAGGVFVISFIYQNAYTTLSNAYNIVVLSSELGADTVDMSAFERAQATVKNIDLSTSIPTDLRNLFEYNIVSPATNTTSTIKQ